MGTVLIHCIYQEQIRQLCAFRLYWKNCNKHTFVEEVRVILINLPKQKHNWAIYLLVIAVVVRDVLFADTASLSLLWAATMVLLTFAALRGERIVFGICCCCPLRNGCDLALVCGLPSSKLQYNKHSINMTNGVRALTKHTCFRQEERTGIRKKIKSTQIGICSEKCTNKVPLNHSQV